MLRKIPVAELRLGMFVAELDRPWTETPFMFQGFVLNAEDQIATLRKLCQFVMVDAERSELGAFQRTGSQKVVVLQGLRKIEHVEKVQVELELPRAREAHASTELTWEKALKDVAAGGTIDAVAVKGAVGKMTESMLRNPDALVLFAALKERGGYLLTRSMNMSIYMIMFARFMGMEQADIERAGMVGLLQDIAMVQLPRQVIEKKGPLTPEELRLVRTHVAQGAEILKATPGLPPEVAQLAALHHERFDGSGYPRGLSGLQLGTIGTIAGIVDTFSAMTTERAYAASMTPSNALGMLHKWRGKTFHPELVEEFIRCIGVFPVGSVVELNSMEVGIVISQNVAKRLQPRVMVVRDAKGQPLRPQKLLDLARSPKMSEAEIYRIRRTLEYGRSGVGVTDVLMTG